MIQKIVCSLLMLMYAQLAYSAAAQTVTYNERGAQKELKEINKKYPLYTIQERFFEAIQHPKWHNAAYYLLAKRMVDGGAAQLALVKRMCRREVEQIDSDNKEVLRWLLDNQAEVNKRDCRGNASLFLACSAYRHTGYSLNHYSIIELLLEKGAHVNMQNKLGETVLMEAVKSYVFYGRLLPMDKEIIKILCRRGADLRMHDKHGQSALSIAADRGGLIELEAEVKNREREYTRHITPELRSLLIACCRLNEVMLARSITDFLGDLIPPLDWEIGMPVVKQQAGKASSQQDGH